MPTAGWDITAARTSRPPTIPPFEWVLPPSGAAGAPATLTTDANGFVNFQWDPLPPDRLSVVTVTEEDTADTTPLDWSCRVKLPDGTFIDSTGTLDPVNPTFDVTVGPENFATCTIRNSFDYDPGISVIKTNTPTRIRGDGRRHAGHLDVRRDQHRQHARSRRSTASMTSARRSAFQGGDTNDDGRLDVTETWTYTCVHVGQSATRAAPLVVPNTIDISASAPGQHGRHGHGHGRRHDPRPEHPRREDRDADLAGRPRVRRLHVRGHDDRQHAHRRRDGHRRPVRPLAFQSGDTSADGLLDAGETWIYTCTATVSEPTVDTVTVTGQPIDLGAPLGGTVSDTRHGRGERPQPPHEPDQGGDARPSVLPGETVTYTFEVSNDSVDATVFVPIAPATRDDVVTDDTCSPLGYVVGRHQRRQPDGAGRDLDLHLHGLVRDPGTVPERGRRRRWRSRATARTSTRAADEIVQVLGPEIGLTKTPSRGVIHSGDSITYTYEATEPRRRAAPGRDPDRRPLRPGDPGRGRRWGRPARAWRALALHLHHHPDQARRERTAAADRDQHRDASPGPRR